MGHLLDIVPNHMAIDHENPWWWDVLENGPASPYSAYFDVDWEPPEARLRNTVLMPILGDHYGRVLEAGQKVVRNGGDSPSAVTSRVAGDAAFIRQCWRGRRSDAAATRLAFIADALRPRCHRRPDR